MILYILQGEKTRRYYVGTSEDVRRRIEQHNHPLGNPSRWTRGGGTWKIIHSHWSYIQPELKQTGS